MVSWCIIMNRVIKVDLVVEDKIPLEICQVCISRCAKEVPYISRFLI